MNEQLRKKIIFGVLALAIVWAWFNIGDQKDSTANEYNVPTIQPLSPAQAGTATEPKSDIDTLALQNADWGADPFRAATKRTYSKYRSTRPLSWKLTGIMYSHEQPLAYINNKMVKIGDLVDDARVVKIDRDRVTLEHNNRKITLTVARG